MVPRDRKFARSVAVCAVACLTLGCWTIDYRDKVNWTHAIDSIEVTVEAVDRAGARLRWRAWNQALSDPGRTREGGLVIPPPRADCEALHLLLKAGQYRLRELSSGDRVELGARDATASVSDDVNEIHVYTHRWDALIDDPCSVWLYALRGEDPRRPLLVGYHGDRRLAEVVLSDPDWSFREKAVLPIVVLLDIVTMPLQLPIWIVIWILPDMH